MLRENGRELFREKISRIFSLKNVAPPEPLEREYLGELRNVNIWRTWNSAIRVRSSEFHEPANDDPEERNLNFRKFKFRFQFLAPEPLITRAFDHQ